MGIIKDLFVTPKMIGAWGEREIVNKLKLINPFGKNTHSRDNMGSLLPGYAVYAAYCSKLPLPVQAGFCKLSLSTL